MNKSCCFIKNDGGQCKRGISLKPNHNPVYCWQHQPKSSTTTYVVLPTNPLTNVINSSTNSLITNWPMLFNSTHQIPSTKLKNSSTKLKGSPTKLKGQPYMTLVGGCRYQKGQLVTSIDVMGQKNLDLEFHSTDPNYQQIKQQVYIDDIQLTPLDSKCEILPLPEPFDLNQHCQPNYQTSVITFESIVESIHDDVTNVINLDGQQLPGRCVIVSDYITYWRTNLTIIEGSSQRVKPQYPRDLATNQEMLPIDIYKILHRGLQNMIVIADDSDPLWFILKDSTFLTDVYNLIQLKTKLDMAYSQVSVIDAGIWNRRDLVLIHEMKQIYQKHKLSLHGWRLYTNLVSDQYAVQVHETCLFVAKLITQFELKKNTDPYLYNFDWIPQTGHKNNDLVGGKDPCRKGVCADIIGLKFDPIYL